MKVEKVIQNAKRLAIIWTILSVLMMAMAVLMIALLGIMLDTPGWVRALLGTLLYAVGQGIMAFMSLASYEYDCIDELKNYLNKVKEYEE